ncbi:MAG TPA: HRDC domain-containing protein, partial [Bryobacteraceae bacterium]
LLWQRKDAGLLAYFNDQIRDRQERNRCWESYEVMRRYVDGTLCRHRQICLHFGETPRWNQCGMCDRCAPVPEWLADSVPVDVSSRQQEVMTADPDLLAILAHWRLETARRAGVPAYVIMNDRSLSELCVRRPLTQAELLEVSGIGAKRAARYGAELIELVTGFRKCAS